RQIPPFTCEHANIALEVNQQFPPWVYSGRVFKKKLRDDEGSAKFLSYGQAYILGEKLLNHDFKNEVLDTLLTEILSGGKIDLTLATLVYEGTAKTSPLRRLLVDIYTWYGHKDWLRYGNNKSHPPPSFCQTSLPLFSSVTITTQPSKTDILSGTHAGTVHEHEHTRQLKVLVTRGSLRSDSEESSSITGMSAMR
ncbi:hypothetical protein D6C88_05561, partial [Aureobasidium pullulans]